MIHSQNGIITKQLVLYGWTSHAKSYEKEVKTKPEEVSAFCLIPLL